MAAGTAVVATGAPVGAHHFDENGFARFASTSTLITTIAALTLTIVFFRSILPRIPRLFLRGRLRVRRAGLRGIRGIEWHSNGFSAVTTKSTPSSSTASGSSSRGRSSSDADSSQTGLVVKVRHVYFTFRRRAHPQQPGVAVPSSAAAGHEQKSSKDSSQSDDDVPGPSNGQAWVTLHIDGLGISLPPQSEDQKKRKAEQARSRRRDAEAAKVQRERESEERLQKLVEREDTPSSPRLGGIGRPLSPLFGAGSSIVRPLSPLLGGERRERQSSLVNMSTVAMESLKKDDSDQSNSGDRRRILVHRALQATFFCLETLRLQVLPALVYFVTQAATWAASSLASLVPFITSIIDLEIHRIEVYSHETDLVFRAKRISLGAHIEVVADATHDPGEKGRQTAAAGTKCGTKFSQRLSAQIASIRQQIETGATSAASAIRERFPAVRVSLQVSTEGIQAFDACRARMRIAEQMGGNSKTHDETKWLSHTLSDVPPSPPRAPSSIHASHEREWRSFSDAAEFDLGSRSRSRRSTLQRQTSDDSAPFAHHDGGRNARWTGTWADWTLKSRPNANFASNTPWARNVEACYKKPITPSARLLAVPTLSTVRLGVGLGQAVSKESLHLAIGVAPVMLSADSVSRVQKRLSCEKHRNRKEHSDDQDQVDSPGQTEKSNTPPKGLVRVLEMLSSVNVHLPSIKVDLSTRSSVSSILNGSTRQPHLQGGQPSSLQLSVDISNVMLSIKNSDVKDKEHQQWLGACGLKGYRDRRNTRAFSNNIRWPGASHKVLVEHRRVYSIDCGMKSITARLGVDGQHPRYHSLLLQAQGLQGHIRSSWTPVGLILATQATDKTASPIFVSDPNEATVIIETKADLITGNLKASHLTSLLTFAQGKKAEQSSSRGAGSVNHSRNSNATSMTYVPRILYHGDLQKFHYELDTSDLAVDQPVMSSANGKASPPHVSLHLDIPHITFSVRSEYSDVYVHRSDQERRQVWKELEKGRLEWSLAPAQIMADNKRLASGLADEDEKAQVRGEELNGDGDDAMDDEPKPSNADNEDSLTMAEAIQEMQQIQKNGRPPMKRVYSNKRRQSREEHNSLKPNLKYRSETVCSFDAFILNWVMQSDMSAPQHPRDDNGLDAGLSLGNPNDSNLTTISFCELKTFAVVTKSSVPAMQDPISNAISLFPRKAALDTRISLEQFDLDLWQSSSQHAINTLLNALQAHSSFQDESTRSSKQEDNAFSEDGDVPAETYIFDYLKNELSIYISVGAISAHIGGIDERCDNSTSRGVGIDITRAVFQVVSLPTEKKNSTEALRLLFGSRSALDLPEDLRSSVASLSLRQGKAAAVKIGLHRLGVFPLLDAEVAQDEHKTGGARETKSKESSASENSHTEKTEKPSSPSIIAPAVWEFQKTKPERSGSHREHSKWRQQDRSNFMIWLPKLALRANLSPAIQRKGMPEKKVEEISVVSDDLSLLSFKIELLHTYCLLNAVSSMKRTFARRATATKPSQDDHSAQQTSNRKGNDRKQKMAIPHLIVAIRFPDVHMDVTLPKDVKVFILMQRFEVAYDPLQGPHVGFEWLMAAVESAEQDSEGSWQELARIRDCGIYFGKDDVSGRIKIEVNADGFNFCVPFGYLVYPIIDNTVVAVKATKQLVLQFLKDSNESFITPVAEDPKHLPVLNFNIRTFAIEAQDDPFETRLNIIWRSGGDENQARAERDVAFEEKLRKLDLLHHRNESEASVDTRSSTDTTSGEGNATKRSDAFAISAEEGRRRLDMYNASSWVRRFTNAKAEQSRREEATKRRIYGRLPIKFEKYTNLPINILPRAQAAPLFRSTMSCFQLKVDPPSFPEADLRDFLHREGQGMPKEMDYSLLIPMHIHISMAEWRVELRDYPMPLLHFPPVNRDKQGAALSGFEVEFDCVIAEQLGSHEALRHVPAIIVPAATGKREAIEYGISVPRMAMPTKFFGSPVITVNSNFTSRIVWGQSIQPAISDCVRILEGITTPPQDPSPRIGFWDKLSLIFHGRVHLRFPNDGQFHLYLKGSREPYHILGHGAGWVKCWRGNVEIRIGFPNEDKEVVQILSDEYLLAIPELKDYIDRAATGTESRSTEDIDRHRNAREAMEHRSAGAAQPLTSNQRYAKEPEFKKVCLKLTNGVRWGSALVLEHTCTDESCVQAKTCRGQPFYRECRFWSRKKHWEVYTRSKDFVSTLPEEEKGDSYEGWRSHHLHFSISVKSPIERADGAERSPERQNNESSATNNFYFTPLAWEHFWAWMRLFDSALGLPIRQGKLFPGSLEQSPKFGKNLGTIKYRFDLAPLFISHVYPQDSKLDWARGRKSLLGIKSRMDVFHLDFHQRQQEVLMDRPELGGVRKRFHKPFYEAEVDLADINFRTVAARFSEPDKRLFPSSEYEGDDEEDEQDNVFGEDGEILTDASDEWYDLQDYVELDWAPRDTGRDPRIKLMEAMACPRFNYYRRIESKRERAEREGNSASSQDIEILERSKFGREDTHTCLVNKAPHPPEIQKDISNQRLHVLQKELDSIAEEPGDDDRIKRENLRKKIDMIHGYISILDQTQAIFEGADMEGVDPITQEEGRRRQMQSHHLEPSPQYSREVVKEWQAFENRFIVHNPIVFYNNATRDVLLKYYLSSRKRRAIVHSLSARAVRYIKNLKVNAADSESDDSPSFSESMRKTLSRDTASETETSAKIHAARDDGTEVKAPKMLQDLLDDTMSHMKDLTHRQARPILPVQSDGPDPQNGISDEYDVKKSNVCILVKPQIVLKSMVNDHSTIIITATRTRMHNYSVVDPSVEEDSVNHRVLHRNFIGVDGLQAFQPTADCIYLEQAEQRNGFIHVPLETLIDLRHSTTDFDRIAPRTDAHIQYDKFNKLRLSDSQRPVSVMRLTDKDDETESRQAGENDHLCHTMDLIRLQCPRYSVSANADQFGAIYNIVTDLLLYRDPAYREHAKKLETMMLSHDYGDVITLADAVQALQVRIRHARELHAQYHLHFGHLNAQGRLDFLSVKAEINDMQDELNLLLEAITASDDSSDKEKKLALRIDAQAEDIGWNMMGDQGTDLLAKLSIRGVSFTWLNKADNSVANTLSIKDMNALNVHPDAVFAEIITKYNKAGDHPMTKRGMLVNAMWSVLAPVGGIGIVDHFELSLHPLRIQLEHRIGRQIEEYIFGSVRDKKRQKESQDANGKKSENGTDNEAGSGATSNGQTRKVSSPLRRLALAVRGGSKDNNSPHEDKSGDPSRDEKLSNTARPGTERQDSSSRLSVLPPDAKRKSTDHQRSLAQKRSGMSLSSAASESSTHRSGTPSHDKSGHANLSHSSGPAQARQGEDDGSASDSDSDEHGQQAIAARNAVEMRERASRTVTFVYFKLSETILCLSYKSEKQRSITDLYDLVFRAPRLEYINRTWAHADLVHHIKKDIFRSAWAQKSTLLKGVINHRRPAQQRMAAAAMSLTRSRQSGLSLSPSVSKVAEPVEKAFAAAQEPFKSNSAENGAPDSSPRFSLYVDPPSIDTGAGSGHTNSDGDDMSADDTADADRERPDSDRYDYERKASRGDRHQSQSPISSPGKVSALSNQDNRRSDEYISRGTDVSDANHGAGLSKSDSNTSSSHSANRSTHSHGEIGTQRKLGRILAKTLHRNKDGKQSGSTADAEPSTAESDERDVREHESTNRRDFPLSGMFTSSGTPDTSSSRRLSTAMSSPNMSRETSRGSENSSPSQPRRQDSDRRVRERTSSNSYRFDSVLGSVRRARERLSSSSHGEDSTGGASSMTST